MNRLRTKDNAKVKVQYIQNHQTVAKNAGNKPTLNSAASQKYIELESNEVENVEYLDETMTEEPADTKSSHNTKESFKDIFYPNAIHCLIALYKNKYLDMKGKTDQQIRAMHIWDQITHEMSESYFNFTRTQIKEKFIQLRTQYFGVSSIEDIENFEYFDHVHDIYHDKCIDEILEGKFCSGQQQLQREYIYRDDKLQLDEESHIFIHEERERTCPTKVPEIVEVREDEIAHKEHEFIDMVEKELQALDEIQTVEEVKSEKLSNEIIPQGQETHELKVPASTPVRMIIIKRGQNETSDLKSLQATKRLKFEKTSAESDQSTNCIKDPNNDAAVAQKELTLSDYNAHQERRHQEKIALIRKSLAIQERSLEIQSKLMEQLINRL